MSWIALKMLMGDTTKYLGIVFGIAFAVLLMSQQSSIFCGLMLNTTSQIQDINGAAIWVMDKNVQFVDDLKPLSENDLYRVRGVPGVSWAVRLYKGLGRARFPNGNFQQFILLGLDDATLVGAPQTMLLGNLSDLKQLDAVIMDENGYRYLWPNDPLELGRTFEVNDRKARLVGICKARPTFQSFPIVYTRYSQAMKFVPRERKVMSFILAQPQPGKSVSEVCQNISDQTGLQALSRQDFIWKTIWYYMKRTGIPINFGITVALGFIVGAAISGQTFYLFTIENLKQFGALKAMGVTNLRLIFMSLLQATVVGLIGFGLGVGGAAAFGWFMTQVMSKKGMPLAFFMPWQVLVIAACGVFVIVFCSSLVSIRRVLILEPAAVFKV